MHTCIYLVCFLLESLLFVSRLQFLPTGGPHSLQAVLHRLKVGKELADCGDGAQKLWVWLDTATSVMTYREGVNIMWKSNLSRDNHVCVTCVSCDSDVPFFWLLFYQPIDLQSFSRQLIDLQLVNCPPLLELVLLQHLFCHLQVLGSLDVLCEWSKGLG